jgi:hypothetical protein
VYEPITLEIDRAHGEGDYRSQSLYFVGRLIQIVEAGHTKMSLYEWADRRGRLLYLVHVEEDKPGQPPRRTLYPFINTHSGGATFWGLPGTRANEVGEHPNVVATLSSRRAQYLNVGRCSRRSSAKRISMQHHYI